MRLSFCGFLVLLGTVACSAQPLLQNADFEAQSNKSGAPDNWQTFAHEGKYVVTVEKTGGPGGKPCLKVEGTADSPAGRAGAFQKTPIFEAQAGLRIRAWTKGETGRRAVVLQFFDVQKPGEIAEVITLPITGKDVQFREFTADVALPRLFRGRKIAVNFLLYFYGTGACWWAVASLTSLDRIEPKLLDAETVPALVRPNPPDGATVSQNPPDFRWRPETGAHTYIFQLCANRDFTGPTLVTVEGIRYNCLNLSKPLAPGTWFWRYMVVTEGGDKSEWSAVRSFNLPENVPVFILPSIEEIRRRIGSEHPRIYVRKSELDRFRQRKEGAAKEWWANYQRGLEARLKAEPAAEPVDADLTKLKKPIDLDYFKVDTRLRQAAGQVADGLWNLAFGYLVSGDKRYADGAKKFLLHVSRWDPSGATSFASNDQVFRDIAIKSAMAYDWIYDTLNEEERALVLKNIQARGRELYRLYAGSNWLILNYPYDSHGQSNIGYLGLIALAVVGDIPEADEWLDYTVKVYCNSFPPWGDADGGWAQGVTYWKWSCFFAFQYVDALRSAAGIDLYQKPWFRQNGWFKLYFEPPWNKYSHFGDANRAGPDDNDANNLAHYAAIYRNPYFQWYADAVRRSPDNSPYGYFFYDSTLEGKPPVDVPQSMCLRDVGWVAMHSALYRPDDIMLFAKSSWFGSWSHSHADQNSFVIYAFGRPLAIDSGHYPWFGSPHHFKWTMQTKAHNAILVDGEGQPIQDITAKGQTLDFLGGKAYAYWLGEAAAAYQGRLKKFHRYILHIRPDRFVIYDDLEATQPTTFQWLLHSLTEMEIDTKRRAVLIKNENARLSVQHILPAQLDQSQTGRFDVPPEPRGGPMPEQWHYTAETKVKSPTARFLTFLHAFENGAEQYECKLVESATAVGLEAIAGDQASFIVFAQTDAGGVAAFDEISFDGHVAACETSSKGISRYLLVKGRHLRLGTNVLVEAQAPISISAGHIGEIFDARITLVCEAKIAFFVGQNPIEVHMQGNSLPKTEWHYDPASRHLELILKAGEYAIEIFHKKLPPHIQIAEFRVGESSPISKWGSALSANNTQTLWGRFEAQAGLYTAKVSGRGDVWVNGEKLSEGMEVFLRARNHLLIETPLGQPVPKVTLAPLYSVVNAVNAVAVPDDDPRLVNILKIEAESYAEGIRGTPLIYSHRTFLSGGKGVSTPPVMGVGARWKFTLEKMGCYQIIFKVATNAVSATRALTVDGRPIFGEHSVVRFFNTGGFGGTPAEWRHFVIAGANGKPLTLYFAAGHHVIELVSVEGLLNLDYMGLCMVSKKVDIQR